MLGLSLSVLGVIRARLPKLFPVLYGLDSQPICLHIYSTLLAPYMFRCTDKSCSHVSFPSYILLRTSNTPSLCLSLKSKYYSIFDDLAHIFEFFKNLKFCQKFRIPSDIEEYLEQAQSIYCKTPLPRLGLGVFG